MQRDEVVDDRLPDVSEARAAVASAGVSLRPRLVAVDKRHHPERGRITEVRRKVEFSSADGPITVDLRAELSEFAQRIDLGVPSLPADNPSAARVTATATP